MHFTIYNRALLRGTIAGAVVLAGASACSRSDRAEAGRDTTQTAQSAPAVTPADSHTVAATQPTATDTAAPAANAAATSEMASKKSGTPRSTPKPAAKVSGYQAMGHDTSTSTDTVSAETSVSAGAPADSSVRRDSVVVGDSAQIGKPGDRLDGAEASQQANADTSANRTESDRVRPPEDSSETIGAVTTDTAQEAAVSNDSAVAGDSAMARDTSSVLAQADTTTTQTQADTVAEASADTAAIPARVDTTTADQQTEVAVETSADTLAVPEDSTQAGGAGERLEPTEASPEANADTLATETERIRPAEDSTEVLGQVNSDRADAAADTSAVGAAAVQSTGNIATGADAVALMTREGQRCAVLNDDRSRAAQWDLASSPATMNPCGTGTMTLPRVRTGEER
jgi:hypothetical protein